MPWTITMRANNNQVSLPLISLFHDHYFWGAWQNLLRYSDRCAETAGELTCRAVVNGFSPFAHNFFHLIVILGLEHPHFGRRHHWNFECRYDFDFSAFRPLP